jgi:hypothetical protein
MKQTIKSIIRTVKSVKGNSLAEFATTTALMATLAATAAPKLSEMSEGTKGEKSRNEIDKLIKQAGNFYQDKADTEGRGRFPGQSKFNVAVGGGNYDNGDASSLISNGLAKQESEDHMDDIMKDLGLKDGEDGWRNYDESHANEWVSCFGTANVDAPLPDGIVDGIIDNDQGVEEWKELVGGETLSSKFQDGHYVYTVVAGYGSGTDVYPPVLFIGDIENMVHFNNVLEP